MKSLEVKFNEALAELKKKASATKYAEVRQQYMPLTSIEAKLNCVEAALVTMKESANPLKLDDLDEAKRDHAILFGVEPRQTTKKESAAPIKKNNGAIENFVEGSPFNGDRGKAVITETDTTKTKEHVGKSGKSGDQIIRESCGIPETKPSSEYERLSEGQKKEFDFARMIGISEADCFRLVRITGGYKQVSR